MEINLVADNLTSIVYYKSLARPYLLSENIFRG